MKKNPILLSALNPESLITLTTEVKEVLAAGHKKNTARILTTADLWDIQRRQKVRSQRRYL